MRTFRHFRLSLPPRLEALMFRRQVLEGLADTLDIPVRAGGKRAR